MTQRSLYFIAGEASGDFLGGQLIRALRQQCPNLVMKGIGGDAMIQQGLTSLFPMQELSLMGITEILPHLPRLYHRFHQTVSDIICQRPDVLVTIDSPGFCHRVAKAAKKKLPHLKIVHYVAPSVWAWRPSRAKKLAQWVDHLVVLFPFEPPYFTVHGLATTFVGHPLLDQQISFDLSFRERYNIVHNALVLVLLPGSRQGEIKRLLPTFCQTAQNLAQHYPSLHVVAPTLPTLSTQIDQALAATSLPYTIVTSPIDKYSAFYTSDVALAASGTVCLELALAGLPMVIAYKVAPVTYTLAKYLVSIDTIGLVNILLQKKAIPEYIQHACTADNLTAELRNILENTATDQKESLQQAIHLLKNPEGKNPSQKAAEVILSLFNLRNDDTNEQQQTV